MAEGSVETKGVTTWMRNFEDCNLEQRFYSGATIVKVDALEVSV
jgi:hypothetical protein